MNQAIKEFYVDNGILTKEFNINTNPKTILKELTKTGIKYTWETVKDERIDNIQSVIEVKVYLPSNILYGRHVYKTADASDAHLYAISEAIKLIVPEYEQQKPVEPILEKPSLENLESLKPLQQPSPTNKPLSQEEILNMMVQEQNATNDKITTAEQYMADTREEIPFDDIELSSEDLDRILLGKPSEQPKQQPAQQSVVSHGFTQNQINAMNEFKQRMNITNDALLGNYINSWDNKLSRKEDLTPANIDAFIEWTKSVGKAPC